MLTPDQIAGKNVLLRADLDVPLEGKRILNEYRLECLLPTLHICLKHAHRILIIGHLGRPGGSDPRFSLEPVKVWLEMALQQPIAFVSSGFSPGEWVRGDSSLTLLENIRFQKGELANDSQFARDLSTGADIYIYDAFASYNTAASLHKIPETLLTVPGLQFEKEILALDRIIQHAHSPKVLVISGAKDDKIKFLDPLFSRFDQILVGGKLATLVPKQATPGDKLITAKLTDDGLDVGLGSINKFIKIIKKAKTIVINGPLGRFEDGTNYLATKAILQATKDNKGAFSLIGGGDTLSAIKMLRFNYSDFGFVSTGGGAMLEYLSTLTHPLLEILKKNNA